MSGSWEEDGATGRWEKWLPWGLLLAYLVGCVVFWTGHEWNPEWDGAVYLLTGQALAAGEGYSYQGEPFFLRPPGLPWMLSFLVDENGFDAHRVNLLVMCFAAAAVAAVFVAVRGLHGAWTALAVALLVGSSPFFVQLFNMVFAEYPFVTFTFLGIASLQVAMKPDARWWGWSIAGAVCLAAAVYMRTVAVLVLPGVVLVTAWRGRGLARLGGVLASGITMLLTLPWWLYARSAAAKAEVPVEQDLLLDYLTAMFRVDPGNPDSALVDFAGWKARLAEHGERLFDDLTGATCFGIDVLVVQILVAVLALVGLVLALRRRGVSLFEWFGLVYAVLLVTYFAYDNRLVMPLVPVVYLYLVTAGFEGAAWLARRGARPVLRPVAAAVLCAALLASNFMLLARHMGEAPDLGPNYRTMARWIRDRTPPGARIMCNQAPIVSLLTDRSAYTFRFVRTADILTKYDIDYFLFDTTAPPPLEDLVRSRRVQHWTIPLGGTDKATIVQVR